MLLWIAFANEIVARFVVNVFLLLFFFASFYSPLQVQHDTT